MGRLKGILTISRARLIVGFPRRAHVTTVRRELHWLPLSDRVTYKVLLLAYKILHGAAHTYITELVNSDGGCSKNSSLNAICWTFRPFQAAAALLCNRLLEAVKLCGSLDLFKTCVKSHLFQAAYN